MLKISENANKNYLAKIVKIDSFTKHPNADKLKIATIDFQNVITGINAEEGGIYVYFPLECAINKDYLSWSNSFDNSDLNVDKTKKGFFNKHGRVRAVKLRGEPSQGYIIPLDDLANWLSEFTNWKGNGITNIFQECFDLNQEFDSFGDILICEKYVVKTNYSNSTKSKPGVRGISRLVENQFRLHKDTENLRKNVDKLNLKDYIGIHYKKHGTSFVVGNVLVNRKLRWFEKVAKWFGVIVQEVYYDIVYSSRKVVKNEYETQNKQGFYDVDIWGIVKEELKDKIPTGVTLYGEILGYLPSGKPIQSKYDYGCKPNEHKTYIYRITITNTQGQVFELDDNQIKEYCNHYGLNYADTFIYYGTVKQYLKTKFSDDVASYEDNRIWKDLLIEYLEEDYNEKDCYMCVNKVPEEGIVLRKQNLFTYEAYKLKAFAFLEGESKQLDAEEVNLEDLTA